LEATFYDMDLKYEGGETSNEALKRIAAVIDDIVASDSHNTIIVAHGGIISPLLQYYDATFTFERWKDLSNPDVFLLSLSQENYHLTRIWDEG
ncbi:MAG TPA: histidine phosphatase family protein, partial [Bacillota bacterium]|nr:histidine phosphatase family protein [Bacillota bacterium]